MNTLIDYGVLFALVSLGLGSLVSNYISTSTALTFSFFMNKKYSFKNETKTDHTQIIKFLIITFFGLWVIQPFIIEGFVCITKSLSINNYVLLFIGKSLAAGVTMVWNYLLYRKFVFIIQE